LYFVSVRSHSDPPVPPIVESEAATSWNRLPDVAPVTRVSSASVYGVLFVLKSSYQELTPVDPPNQRSPVPLASAVAQKTGS